MRYYLVAGEASGDLHGSNLMKAISGLDPAAEFRCWGGDLMAAQPGATLVSHYKERAYMGLWEVITHIRTIAGFLKQAEQDILANKPDALILIDNPGFNLRLAAFAKKHGIPVHYYIAPKVWAWNTKRVKKIKRDVDYLYSILPFEPEFFSAHQVKVDYVGNPIVDAISQFNATSNWKETNSISKPIIAVLPGSRKHEIHSTLPLVSSLILDYPEYEFVVAGAPGYDEKYLRNIAGNSAIKIGVNDTYNILNNAHAAIVASGTATLETAAFNVPQVVCYKVAALTYFIGKMVIQVKWVSLVNLILNRELVRELLQKEFTKNNLKLELDKILNGKGREKMLEGYKELNAKLGLPGASAKTAELIVGRMQKKAHA
ncbi:MAG: lipid-A-disaccharide synthase [Bacteroidia bacterium]|nr:lipid-A-disaccharide synthase [Bacteroidia bacterium]